MSPPEDPNEDNEKQNQKLKVVDLSKYKGAKRSKEEEEGYELGTEDDLDPDLVLKGALDKLSTVIVLGTKKDGSLYFGLSSGDPKENTFLLHHGQLLLDAFLLEGSYLDTDE